MANISQSSNAEDPRAVELQNEIGIEFEKVQALADMLNVWMVNCGDACGGLEHRTMTGYVSALRDSIENVSDKVTCAFEQLRARPAVGQMAETAASKVAH